MAFEQTWRWFGPNDPITLEEVKQTGARGIVTALHHIPSGESWPVDEILARKQMIESRGLTWSVVESVPVHDDIKRRSGGVRRFIEAYKQTIRNIGRCGIDLVCYNFMPMFDWCRTDLRVELADGSLATKFDMTALAAFDIFILRRKGAEETYDNRLLSEAEKYFRALSDRGKEDLVRAILLGLPGSGETYALNDLKAAVRDFAGVGERELRDHLYEFLGEIIPVAQESGVRMAVHPDDPPWPILGLPRVLSTGDDLERLLDAVDSPANGLTFCTGSLAARSDNDVAALAQRFASRIHFLHLRNVTILGSGSFVEADHLEGVVDLHAVMKTLLLEQQQREAEGRSDYRIPLRPDHGHLMAADRALNAHKGQSTYPGYSLFGRMRGLAELRGLELGIRRSSNL